MILELYMAHGTQKATFFMLVQRQSAQQTAKRSEGVWIPKRLYTIVERAEAVPWTWPRHRLEVPDWFAKKERISVRQQEVRAKYGL